MKLHLGCGRRQIPGMVHVDLQDYPHVDHRCPVQRLSFAADDSCELVYASHVLEHFGRYEYKNVLQEWYRVLCPGGVLRLAVPDFARCAELYHEAGLADGLSGLLGLVCGGQRNDYDFHKMIFDEPFLQQALEEVGFQQVRRWDWQATEHSQVDDYSQSYLPHLDKQNGRLMSLNLEAIK
ncbi:MAG: class I SAM-dependent methyltransferase [Cyanobium sp.]